MKFNSFEYLQYVAASSVNGMVFDGCGYNRTSRPVHTRHNLNAYLIRYWTMCIKYALVPSTLLKKQVDLSNLRGVSIT